MGSRRSTRDGPGTRALSEIAESHPERRPRMHGVGVYAGPDRPPDASWGDEGERLREAYGQRGRRASVRFRRPATARLHWRPAVTTCRGADAHRWLLVTETSRP